MYYKIQILSSVLKGGAKYIEFEFQGASKQL